MWTVHFVWHYYKSQFKQKERNVNENGKLNKKAGIPDGWYLFYKNLVGKTIWMILLGDVLDICNEHGWETTYIVESKRSFNVKDQVSIWER